MKHMLHFEQIYHISPLNTCIYRLLEFMQQKIRDFLFLTVNDNFLNETS